MSIEPSHDQAAVRLVGITKRFPGVQANDGIDLDVRPGEIHALLGENGAGKSTLMKVLSGICQPDAGEVLFEGEKIRLKDTMDAEKRGISIVHQELAVFPTSTVGENVFINHPPRTRWGGIDYRRMYREVRSLLERYPEAPTARQSIGYKEVVAHVRGEATLEEAIEAVTVATARYAKRQRTWFRREPGVHVLAMTGEEALPSLKVKLLEMGLVAPPADQGR